jgi:immune inhibitor A
MTKPVLTVLGCIWLLAAATSLAAMPLRPDVVDRLRAEGRLAEERTVMEQALKLGVNSIADNEVYQLEAGAPLTLTTRAAIVILADFSDNVADTVNYPTPHYDDMLFTVGTYVTGSLRDYYLENSYGNFDVPGLATGWYRMPETYAYYVDGQRGFGAYPKNAKKLVENAVLAADPYVDFSQYDNDGPDGIPHSGDDDGYVDALFVVHAGPGYETTGNVNDIHSHAGNTSYAIPVDGVYVRRYSIEPDDGKIGVFCHEFGHVLGLPDLYDYGYDSEGAGKWSLMASGSWGGSGNTPTHIDAWGKIKLGFIVPVVPTTNLIDVAIPRAEDEPVAYKVWTGGAPGKEYFVIEHRRKTKFDLNLPSKGLVIYHVDENMTSNDNQRCGAGSPHYRVAVEQADGECDLENNVNQGDAGDPYPGTGGTHNPNTRLNLVSTPNSKSYADVATGVAIYNIHFTEGMGYASVAVGAVPPTAWLTNNNGGDTLQVGDPDTVRWIAFDDIEVDSVSVLLSRDGGTTWPETLAHGEANDSSFVWTVTGPMSSHCRIRVVAYDRDGYTSYDTSDADFEIFDPTATGAMIVFSAPTRAASAAIYDVTGRLVRSLAVADRAGAQDTYQAYWDGRTSAGEAASAGVYFAMISSGGRSRTARVTMAR